MTILRSATGPRWAEVALSDLERSLGDQEAGATEARTRLGALAEAEARIAAALPLLPRIH